MENPSDYILYTRDGISIKQWEHPNFKDIRQRLEECNIIRYSAYRVAAKLRVLQHALFTSNLPLALGAGVFARHRLGATESSLMLECFELEAVLSDIYFAAHKNGLEVINVDYATDLMLNFLYNVFDKEKIGSLPVLAAKVCVAVLSNASLVDIYRYFYSVTADHNNCVTRRRLQSLLMHLAAIAEFLQEGSMFGQPLVLAAVETCFNNSPGMVGVTEDTFLMWLQDSPSILSWLTTFNRLRIAEGVSHDIKCSACKAYPIVGLRYRCIRCVRYNQCQTCYFTARISNNHKLKHPMQEHCTPEISCEITQALLKKFKGFISCSNAGNQNHTSKHFSTSNLLPNSIAEQNISVVMESDSSPINSAEEHLTSIIRQLEQQNRQLQQQMSTFCKNTADRDMWRCLEEHRTQVATQVQKLKLLKQYLQSSSGALSHDGFNVMESTPVIPISMKNRNCIRSESLDFLSPIVMKPELLTPRTLSVTHNETTDSSRFESKPVSSYYDSMPTCSVQDISTWIGGRPVRDVNSSTISTTSRAREVQGDLDAVLEKLQEILANNFTFEDPETTDNGQLQHAVTEMEDMLSTLIDGVEKNRNKRLENSQII